MKIQKVQEYNTNFQSKFVPNKTLSNAFDIAMIENDGKFLKAIEKLMQDGKPDTIELMPEYTASGAYKKLSLKVNDVERRKTIYAEPIDSIDGSAIVSAFDAQELIIAHAKLSENKINLSPLIINKRLASLLEKIFKN